jgi:hypothetical protein
MTLTHSGLVIELTDTWSTTGPATSVDLLVEAQFNGRISGMTNLTGFEFPGETTFAAHHQGDLVPIADPGGPATLLYSLFANGPDDATNPRASISMVPVPDKAFFFGTHGDKFLLHYAFTIPAGGSYTIRTVNATENTLAALAPLTTAGEDGLQSPTVAITTPADGATVQSPSVTVSGTATDNVGVASVTVNGQAATLGSGTFSKEIALAEASNAITVVASDAAGNTATATRSVTYTKPAGSGGTKPDGGGGDKSVTPPAIGADGTVACPPGGAVCVAGATWTSVKKFVVHKKKRRRRVLLAKWGATIAPGQAVKAKPKLTKKGRRLLRKRSRRAVRTIVVVAGNGTPVTATATVKLKRIKHKKTKPDRH